MANGMNSRFFTVEPNAYEQTRLAVDAAWGFSATETSIEPLATAPKDSNGQALIAIRAMHCDMEPFKSAVEGLLASEAAAEITQAEYEAALPQPEGGPQQ
jgi:hypothetical protein